MKKCKRISVKRLVQLIFVLLALAIMVAVAPVIKTEARAADWDGTIATYFAGGSGTELSPYIISNGSELALLSQVINGNTSAVLTSGGASVPYATLAAAHYKLTADISLNNESFTYEEDTALIKVTDGASTAYIGTGRKGASGGNTVFDETPSTAGKFYTNTTGTLGAYAGMLRAWAPIGKTATKFNGKFDGDNHTISGIYINNELNEQGFFGYNSGSALVKNVGMLSSYVYGYNYIGTLVGYNVGTINNCYNAGIAGAFRASGGVTGYNSGTISYCRNEGTIVGRNYVAGIVGQSENGLISNCYNTANIYSYIYDNSNNSFAAGIAGHGNTDIFDCYNLGDVYGTYMNNGGITGRAYKLISGCYNKGNIFSDGSYSGGVAGDLYYDGVMNNCYNTAPVIGTSVVGGVLGGARTNCIINNCYNIGEVVGISQIGGVIGQSQASINNCYNSGSVIGGAYLAGGVAGNSSGAITNCYYLENCAIDSNSIVQNGIGHNSGDPVASDVANATTKFDTSATFASAITVGSYSGTQLLSVLNAWVQTQATPADYYSWKHALYPSFTTDDPLGWDGTAAIFFAGGSGTELNPYQISDANQLALLSQIINKGAAAVVISGGASVSYATLNAAYYKLTANIVLNNEVFELDKDTGLVSMTDGINTAYIGTNLCGTSGGNTTFDTTSSVIRKVYTDKNGTEGVYTGSLNLWTPIGNNTKPFKANFDGAGHNISGIYIESAANFIGLFGYRNSSSAIKNLGLKNGFVCGYRYVGGIVGYNYTGDITDCYNEAIIVGEENETGGIVGSNSPSLDNCYNSGTIIGFSRVGGIVGAQENNTINNCYNSGDIYTDRVYMNNASSAGGIAGTCKGTINDSYNLGSIYGVSYYVGGIAGEIRGEINNCYNEGSIAAPNRYGAGGIAGYANGGTITNSNNSGIVTGLESAGGVVGSTFGTVNFRNCFNTASIVSNTLVGGVVGRLEANGTAENCYNSGNIIGSNRYVGGVVGQNRGVIKNCYNTANVSGPYSVGGVGGDNENTIQNCYYLKACAKHDNGLIQNGIGRDNVNFTTEDDIAKTAPFDIYGNLVVQMSVGLYSGRNLLDIMNAWIPAQASPSNYTVWFNKVYPTFTYNPTYFAGGSGTSLDPYLISSAKELALLSEIINGNDNAIVIDGGGEVSYATLNTSYYKLTTNLILNDEVSTLDKDTGLIKMTDGTNTIYIGTSIKGDSSGANTVFDTVASVRGSLYVSNDSVNTGEYSGAVDAWVPIGSEALPFRGSFDGNGYYISGLFNYFDYDGTGFFGYGIGATIKNFGIESGLFCGKDSTGGIIAVIDDGSITNCYNKANIVGNTFVGGISAYADNSSILNCYNYKEVIGQNYVGGITGVAEAETIIVNCYNAGYVNGPMLAGGVVALINYYTQDSIVKNCYYLKQLGGINEGIFAVGAIGGEQYLEILSDNDISSANVYDIATFASESSLISTKVNGINYSNISLNNLLAKGAITIQTEYPEFSYYGWEQDDLVNDGYPTFTMGGELALTVKYNTINTLEDANVQLFYNGSLQYTLLYNAGVYSLDIIPGLYEVYLNNFNTFAQLNIYEGNYDLTLNLYTVTYNGNGVVGTLPTMQYYGEGAEVAVSSGAMLSKTGYTFIGFGETSNSKTIITSITIGTSPITLYAVFNLNSPSVILPNNATAKSYGDILTATYTHDLKAEAGASASYKWMIGEVVVSTVDTYMAKASETAYALSCTVTFSINGDESTGTSTKTYTVNKRQIGITIDDKTSIYGETVATLTSQVTTGSVVDDDHLQVVLTKATGANVGNYTITGAYDNDNYAVTFVNGNYEITLREIFLGIEDKSSAYGETQVSLTYTIESGSIVDGDDLHVVLTKQEGDSCGNYAITSEYDNDNYDVIFGKGNYTITVREVTITIADKYSRYGEMEEELSYAVTTGSIINNDDLQVELSKAMGDNAGNYVITGIYSNSNYGVTFVDGNYEITAREITITIEDKFSTYGDSLVELTYYGSIGGVIGSDDLQIELTKDTGDTVGNYAITGQYNNSNYDITFIDGNYEIKTMEILITIANKSSIYGETLEELTYLFDMGSAINGDDLQIEITKAAGANIGSYAITGSYSNENYEIFFTDGSYEITERTITVTISDATSVYGESFEELTYEVTSGSIIGEDDLKIIISKTEGTDANGYYPITGDYENANYIVIFVDGEYTITQRPITITIDDGSGEYGELVAGLTYEITAGDIVGSDDLQVMVYKSFGTDVGFYTIDGVYDNNNYNVTFINGTFEITKRMLTLTITDKNSVYGDTIKELTYEITIGNIIDDDDLQITLTKEVGTSIGYYTITGECENENYLTTFVDGIYEIVIRQITITIADITSTYGEYLEDLSYSVTTGSIANFDDLQIQLAKEDGETVGNYAITGSYFNSNYVATFVNGTYAITAREVTITIRSESYAYGEDIVECYFDITVGSVLLSDDLEVTLTKEEGTAVGNYAITGQYDNDNYAVTFIDGNYEITIRVMTITIEQKNTRYGEALAELTYIISDSAFLDLDSLNVVLTKEEGLDIGYYAITGEYDNSNCDITFTTGMYEISVCYIGITIDGKTSIYGDEIVELTYYISSGEIVENDDLQVVLTKAVGSNVGDYGITGECGNANYQANFIDGNYGITAREITITISDKTSSKGGAIVELTYAVTTGSIIGEDDLQIVLTKEDGTEIGEYAITGQYDNDNYQVTFIDGIYTIQSREITITIASKTSVYGEEIVELTYIVTEGIVEEADDLQVVLTKATGVIVGNYAITGDYDNDNYNVTFVDGNYEITAREITVTIDDKTSTYGEETAALTSSITSGNIIGEDNLLVALTKAVGLVVGSYAITGTYNNDNYNVTFVDGSYAITAREITITIDDKSSIYGEALVVLTYEITTSNLIGEDDLQVALTKETGIIVGSYAITGGYDNDNYNVTFVDGNYAITVKAIEIEITDRISMYGDEEVELKHTTTSGTILEGDELSVVLNKVNGTSVGEYDITGSYTNSNYDVTFIDGIYTIFPRDVTVTIDIKVSVYGDELLVLSYTITAGNVVYKDDLQIELNKEVGTNASSYAITGEYNNDNYNVGFVDGSYQIAPRPVSFAVDNKSSVYGETLQNLTYSLTSGNVLQGDSLNVRLSSDAENRASTYPITASYSNNNYDASFTEGTYVVSKRALEIAVEDKTSKLGQSLLEPTYTILSGEVVDGDDLGIKLDFEVGESEGVYPIIASCDNENYEINFKNGEYYLIAETEIERDNLTAYLVMFTIIVVVNVLLLLILLVIFILKKRSKKFY